MLGSEWFARLGVFVRRGFLDAELCARACRAMAAAPQEPAVSGLERAVNPKKRRVLWCDPGRTLAAEIDGRLSALMPELAEHFNVALSGFQEPGFLLYRTGDFHRLHQDHYGEEEAPTEFRERIISIVVFLNDASDLGTAGGFAGGELVLYGLLGKPELAGAGFPLHGEAGLAVAFLAGTPHEVKAVTAGERFTLVTWFY